MSKTNNKKMIISAMFLAVAYLLPFFTGQIPQIGSMLCPMHIPVLLCGFVCGAFWGGLVGLAAPVLRSVTLGMPVLFPMAVCMALELFTYGTVAGFLHKVWNGRLVYVSLLLAMTAGRLVWGLSMFFCMKLIGAEFGSSAFLAGAVTNAVPGIIVQIILVPILVKFLKNKGDLINLT